MKPTPPPVSRFGRNIVRATALHMAAQEAARYEREVATIGGGVPPINETIHVHMMWCEASQECQGEA